jgi:hypothetical protein
MQSQFFDRARALLGAIMRDGTVAAMGREAIKDVRNTLHETYFGQGEHGGEPGAPLNPTQGEIAAARQEDPQLYGPKQETSQAQASPSDIAKDKGGVHGPQQKAGHELRSEAAQGDKDRPSPSPSEIAKDKGGVHGPGKDRGGEQQTAQKPPEGYSSWEEYLQDREKQKLSGQGDKDGYEKDQGRLKEREEKENQKEQENQHKGPWGGRGGRCG